MKDHLNDIVKVLKEVIADNKLVTEDGAIVLQSAVQLYIHQTLNKPTDPKGGATFKQLGMLKHLGITDLPKDLTLSEASKMISEAKARKEDAYG